MVAVSWTAWHESHGIGQSATEVDGYRGDRLEDSDSWPGLVLARHRWRPNLDDNFYA